MVLIPKSRECISSLNLPNDSHGTMILGRCEKAVCLSCSLGGFSSGGAQEAGRRCTINLQVQKDFWELNVGEKAAKGAAGHNKCGLGRQRGK